MQHRRDRARHAVDLRRLRRAGGPGPGPGAGARHSRRGAQRRAGDRVLPRGFGGRDSAIGLAVVIRRIASAVVLIAIATSVASCGGAAEAKVSSISGKDIKPIDPSVVPPTVVGLKGAPEDV